MRNEKQNLWEFKSDTPEEFEHAIANAETPNEKIFFEKMRCKILHETAASNDIIMHDNNNEDGIYILRVGTDDFQIGKIMDGHMVEPCEEFSGLFFFLTQDLDRLIHRHVTVGEWLKEQDYSGISYDANNDYM